MNRNLTERKIVIIAIFVVVGFIFLIRLFYIQVIDESYILSAESNVLRKNTIYPNRGVIFDRNGMLLVYDEAAYDIMVVPRQVKSMDTLEFCRLLDITIEDFRLRLKKAINYSRYKPTIFISQISKEEYGYIEEKLYKYPGFFVQLRSLRKYLYPIAAHLFGYIGEVNNQEIAQDSYYKILVSKPVEASLNLKDGILLASVPENNSHKNIRILCLRECAYDFWLLQLNPGYVGTSSGINADTVSHIYKCWYLNFQAGICLNFLIDTRCRIPSNSHFCFCNIHIDSDRQFNIDWLTLKKS